LFDALDSSRPHQDSGRKLGVGKVTAAGFFGRYGDQNKTGKNGREVV